MSDNAVRLRITEYLEVDLAREMWVCQRCGGDLGSARRSYKRGCRVADRNPQEIHRPLAPGERYTLAPDPEWVRLLEFYCPHCFTLIETEYLPPGHPITVDIELDIDRLKARHGLPK